MEVFGADLRGINGQLVKFRTVQESNSSGVKALGLASKVVREGIVRAGKAAQTLKGNWDILSNSGYTIDLSPAEIEKTSSGLELPIAIMLLQAFILQNLEDLENKAEDIKSALEKSRLSDEKRKRLTEKLKSINEHSSLIVKYKERLINNKSKYLLIGKLDIVNGGLESPYYGMLGLIAAAEKGFTLIVPDDAEIHASLVAESSKGIKAYIASNLQEVWDVILGETKPREAKYIKKSIIEKSTTRYIPNLKAIKGVARAKKALRVSLAGGHNILLVGPPGQGKTMLSKAATKMLPMLNKDELFVVNKIYSAKGVLNKSELVIKRPFQEAHENITLPALMGGGSRNKLVPGLVSLAHKGILYFDEINLFPGKYIEHLRTAMSNNIHSVQRVNDTVEYPCNFTLVAAMNPCKCGWHKHYQCPECNYISLDKSSKCPSHNISLANKCTCSNYVIENYKNKLSTPLLDRIDLKVLVSAYDSAQSKYEYSTSTVRKEVFAARDKQKRRYKKSPHIACNADVPDADEFYKFNDTNTDTKLYFNKTLREHNISTKRTEVKVLLVSRTVADLDNSRHIKPKHINEAVNLMGLTDTYFKDM